jgi:uncharacterized protein
VTPRVLCDTNVLVSAFIAGGPPSRVIEAAIDGRIEFVIAEPVLDELDRVLTVKLGFEPERTREIATLLGDLSSTRVSAPTAAPEPITGDPDDDLVLACSAEAAVQIVVSGDRRHMLPIGEYRGARIITPQTLLSELANSDVQRRAADKDALNAPDMPVPEPADLRTELDALRRRHT